MPYGETSDTDKALPADSGIAKGLGEGKTTLHNKNMLSVKALALRNTNALSFQKSQRQARVRSIYYHVTMMPTGPPSEDKEDYLPSEYHHLVNAALHPSTRRLKHLLKPATLNTDTSDLISKDSSRHRSRSGRRNVLVFAPLEDLERGTR
jgi:hypothetical protein